MGSGHGFEKNFEKGFETAVNKIQGHGQAEKRNLKKSIKA